MDGGKPIAKVSRKLVTRGCRLMLAGAGVALLCLTQQPALAQTIPPPDAQTTCVVAPQDFKNWFVEKTVTVNGAVSPADSVTFQGPPECNFYRWSQRMFLWLTSPADPSGTKPGFVFESPLFFDVSHPDQGKRRFIPHQPGKVLTVGVSIPQRGPLNRPVAIDASGKMFPIVRPSAATTGLRNKLGEKVELSRTEIAPDGKPVFVDKGGKKIDPQVTRAGNLRLVVASGKVLELRPIPVVLSGRQFFLSTTGEAVDLGLGQGGFGDITENGNVLMAQGGSLVYYAIQTNDVFAYFLTGERGGGITPRPAQFPTTQKVLDQIKAFAQSKRVDLPDANALTMEVKSSWIEATGLDASKYVTINAMIPKFDPSTSTDKKWVPMMNAKQVQETKQVQLALVGMHVVGSVAGHPEMIWATFEHVNNAPSGEFKYSPAAGGVPKTGPQSNAGPWLFSASSPSRQSNRARMSVDGAGNIVALDDSTIGPSNLLRLNPWGTNASDANAVRNNTDIISINNSVLGMLAAGDVRKNYVMVGSTWKGGNTTAGSTTAANATMETFVQSVNCLGCHAPTNGLGVSHIYRPLQPLR